jgi:hypothetical protein
MQGASSCNLSEVLAYYIAMPSRYPESVGREHLCASRRRSFRSCLRSSDSTPRLRENLGSQI